ncbi:uncharacterized protein [Dysidea avara]|uniref:uncharacterized protein isoform X2 n=1 Tax=Dysidea avara TaxID=196820 RepID=UPI00332351FC
MKLVLVILSAVILGYNCGSAVSPVLVHGASTDPATLQCDICEEVVKIVEQYAEENKTEAEVKQAIEQFCNSLPAPLNGVCSQLVDQYFDEIWELIINDEPPQAICTNLGLCSSKLPAKTKLKAPLEPTKLASLQCDICEEVVKIVEQYAEENKTEAEVKQAVEQFCNSLPAPLNGVCSQLVDQYFDEIWELIINDEPPQTVCTNLGLCSSKLPAKTKPKAPLEPTKLASLQCDICEEVVKIVDQYAEENKTEAEVKQAIEQFCDALPAPLNSVCSQLVDQYFDEIWELIINDESPQVICTDLGLCSSKLPAKSPKVENTVPTEELHPAKVASLQCDICEEVVKIVEQYAEDNETEAKVKEAVEQFCTSLPAPLSSVCSDLVDQYFDEIWEDIINNEPPHAICTNLGLCSSKLSAKSPVEEPTQTLCEECKVVVSVVKMYVDKNETETDIEKVLKDICALLPSDSVAECNSFVDDYYDTIYTLIKSEIDSGQICTILKLCPSVNNVPQLHQRVPEEEAEKGLLSLCNLLPSSNEATCKDLVTEYLPVLYILIKQEIDSGEICVLIKLCPSVTPVQQPTSLKQSPLCDVCEAVVSFVKPYVDANGTKKEIEDALEEFCDLLQSSQCKDIVVTSFPTIWLLLKEGVDTGEVCAEIGLCGNTTKTVVKKPAQTSVPKVKQSNVTCEICQRIVAFAKPFVDSTKDKDEVRTILEDVCNLLPSNTSSQCLTYVKDYFGIIWALLKDGVDSGKICTEIRLCDNAIVKQPTLVSVPNKVKQSNVTCEICQMIVGFVKPFVDSTKDKDEVKALLEDFCNLSPSNTSAECLKYVKEYFNVVWTLLKTEVDTGDICGLIGLCPKSQLPVNQEVASVHKYQEPEAGVLCVLCEYVMKEIEAQLPINATEDEIIHLVDNICSELPSTITAECQDFVNKYGKDIIDALINDVGPNAVCVVIHLCTTSTKNVKSNIPVGGVECDLCLYVTKYLDAFLDSNSTIEEIIEVLEQVCNVLPSDIQDTCTDLLNEFGYEIIDRILVGQTPHVICSELKLCSSITKAANELMGSSRCTWGPAYWCSSRETAVECNAEEYCKAQKLL